MARIFLIFFPFLLTSSLWGQVDCRIHSDEIDPFDSLRTISSESLALGNMLLSQVETLDGPKLAPEAEGVVMYTESDSLNLLFLHLELPEYKYVRTAPGYNIKLKMASDTIVGFYTIPDEGTFSKATNMRHYQHTGLVPVDLYYMLTHDTISLVRVEYENHRRTILVTEEQALALRESFRCVGERVGWYPVKP